MPRRQRLPWTPPAAPGVPALDADQVLALNLGDPWSQVVAIAHALSGEGVPALSHVEPRADRFTSGPLAGRSVDGVLPEDALLPALLDREGACTADDPLALVEALAPSLFAVEGQADRARALREGLLDAVTALRNETDQRTYEDAHAALGEQLHALDDELAKTRFLAGDEPGVADMVLFTFSVRLDPVYYELHKASVGLLADFPHLLAHAQDLYERPACFTTTDLDLIKREHYRDQPVLNPKGIVPSGGAADLDAPHFRDRLASKTQTNKAGVEEDQGKARAGGEWVRPASRARHWITDDEDAEHPAVAGRYHLYAPFNCPWSHRALLGRAVKGLEDVVGVTVVYFRRHPERGWQMNPAIPGCTADGTGDRRFVVELYEQVDSPERSVPVLWDALTERIVSNESADILRMFNDAFGRLARRDLDLYPAAHRERIDAINALVYQRVNNGAYKAGFASSQQAYDRACARYFRALDWLEALLVDDDWLAGTPGPSEADLRLFPTLFRHDAVYFSRFKLNLRRLSSYPRLSGWMARMLEVPGVAEACDLDHARNGYFGRSGNEVVPAGPSQLGISSRSFDRATWLNEQ